MAKSKTESVKIPMELMSKIIRMLEYLEPDLDEYDHTIVEDHYDIVLALKNKKKSIELRDDYSRFIKGSSHDMHWGPHIENAQHKYDEADLPF